MQNGMVEARNLQFLFYGLAAAWIIVIGYIFYLVRRDRKLQTELARLRNMVASDESRR